MRLRIGAWVLEQKMSEIGGLGGFSAMHFKLLCPLFWGQKNPDMGAMLLMCQAIDLYSGVRWIYPVLALFALTLPTEVMFKAASANDTTHTFLAEHFPGFLKMAFEWVWDFSDQHQSSLLYATTAHQIIWEQRGWWIYKSKVIICSFDNHANLFYKHHLKGDQQFPKPWNYRFEWGTLYILTRSSACLVHYLINSGVAQ